MDNMVMIQYVILGVLAVGLIILMFLSNRKFDVGAVKDILDQFREKVDDDMGDRSGELKRDMKDTLGTFTSVFSDNLSRFSSGQSMQIKQLQDGLKNQFDTFSTGQARESEQLRGEVTKQIFALTQTIERLKGENSGRMKDLQELVNRELERVRKDNEEKLEKISKSVDEQLESKLQKSVQQSFNTVLSQLQQVDKSLGEMQSLAKEVGGLKKILGNVKTRGNFGEVQLETILDEIIPGRYEKQVMIQAGSQDRVDFAISLPGDTSDSPVLLPIDSKFPFDAFGRLQKAREDGDKEMIDQAVRDLRNTVKAEAKSIHDKYIQVPKTTVFAIMFLAAESVYAEVISQTDLVEELRKNYQVTIAGPSTMVAFLNSLQMGFHTLKITESAGKVNIILQNTKRQFMKFEDTLKAMQRRIRKNSEDIDELLTTRTNKILNSLKTIEVGDDYKAENLKEMVEENQDVCNGTDKSDESL